MTDGSGATAVVGTSYSDNDGHAVLSILYPSAGVREFTLSQYDLVGNPTSASHASAANGVQTTWQTANSAYDGLNRMTSKTDRDNALTQFAYDAAGDLTNRTMPGGVLAWRATYNNTGQILQEYNLGSGNAGARTNTYAYYSSSSPFLGLLQTRTDGRGVICTHVYDDWLRTLTLTYTNTAVGSPAEQSLTTAFGYEARGMLTNITENFASTNTGPATAVSRSYDPNGLLTGENIDVGGSAFSRAGQYWNSWARRAALGIGDFGYSYGWRADGRLVSATGSTGGGSYAYVTAGLLLSRTLGPRVTSINQRDGAGRPYGLSPRSMP